MFKTRRKEISVVLLIGMSIFIIFYLTKDNSRKLTGVYWGAFDPPTEAHAAIIMGSLNDIPLKKLIVVVNNHPYKNYTYPLEVRMRMIRAIIHKYNLEGVELCWQDESHRVDFKALKERTHDPLCAIAGYDAYQKWVAHSTSYDRSSYDAIAVIPRGGDNPILFDKRAFLLPIDSKYRDVSSTKVRTGS